MAFEIHDPVSLLKTLCALPSEQNWAEFKENMFNSETVGKYVSGLANAAMLENQKLAFMVWGVRDITHDIVGTNVKIATEMVGSERFLLWLDKYIRPKLTIHPIEFETNGARVEMLVIEPGYSQPVSFKGQEYVRIATSLTPLREHVEKTRALWAITSSYSFENATIIPHISAENLFKNFDVSQMLKMLKVQDRSNENILEILQHRGLIASNMQGGFEVTALLAMSCANSLDDFPLLENKGSRVITYWGTDKLRADDDIEGKRGYLVGFQGLLAYIMSKIPSQEQMLHGIRTKVYQIAEEAVREFLANTLIHQDFTVKGQRPLIEIYKDRIRFINPGKPLIDLDRFIDGGTKSRNPNFARLMRHAGLCEERGSGVDRAIKEIEKTAAPPPLFSMVEDSTSVTVFTTRRFADMTAEERIRACFQHAQVCLEANEPMSNASLRKRFGLPDKQISQVSIVIREAQDAGKIKPLNDDQANRNARYVPAYA
jgi:ATP-dependent DNA helicase RecG